MMNKDKPTVENAWQKAKRLKEGYTGIIKQEAHEEQVYFHWNKEREMSAQICGILINDVWEYFPPGIQTMLYYQIQTYLKRHFDSVQVPQGKCLDVYGRLTNITKDWRPESNDIP